MILKMYAVYDSKLESYLQPFFMQTQGAALRAWDAVVNDSSTQFSKNPADYTLFELGQYDDSTGIVESYQAKKNLGTALEFIKTMYDGSKTPNLKEVTQ